MNEAQEEAAYDAQDEWIQANIGKPASRTANYGWFVDEVEETISTKVYGHGVLTTHVPTFTHTFEEFS